jgi:hypothetical protein
MSFLKKFVQQFKSKVPPSTFKSLLNETEYLFFFVIMMVSATLVGRTVWDWLTEAHGLSVTFIVGLILLAISAVKLHKHHD